LTLNEYLPAAQPQPVTIVRPPAKELGPQAVLNLFIGLPLAGLIVWAAFLGVGNELLHADISYWQSLLLVIGVRTLKGGAFYKQWTRKNPQDRQAPADK
jgi:hypothetical protein